MDENAEAEVVETEEQQADVIKIADVENPQWISLHEGFLAMVKRFVEDDLKDVPSIRYESLINYMAATVDGICKQKLMGVHDSLIQSKLQVGMVNGTVKGFQMFHMLPNRLPHIQTMNVAYVCSDDMRVTYRFALEVAKYKKKWKAQFISTTVTNGRLNSIMKRFMKKCVVGGTYYIARGINHGIIKS